MLVAVMAVLLLVAGPVYATPPIPVSGTFDYTYSPIGTREADGNMFLYATEHEWWGERPEEPFVGESDAYFRVEMFRSGFWNVWLRTTFTGTVQDKSCTLVIQLVGKKPADGEWYGRWVILSGTCDEAKLRGQGTWWGLGYEGEAIPGERPDIFYEGKIHFEPD